MKIIFFTLIVYFLMDRFQVFNLVHRNMKGYDIRFIYGVKIALLTLVLYVSIKNIPYFHGIEGITNQEVTLEEFVIHLRNMVYKFYECDDNNSLRCKILFLEKRLSTQIDASLKTEIIDTLRKYQKKEGCDVDTRSILFFLGLLNIYSSCNNYEECLSHMKYKINIYYPCIKNNLYPEDQKIIQSFYNQIKEKEEMNLEEIKCDESSQKNVNTNTNVNTNKAGE